jgi:hypothetical protein
MRLRQKGSFEPLVRITFWNYEGAKSIVGWGLLVARLSRR